MELTDKAQKALRLFEDGCLHHHDQFCEKYQRNYRSYRAILDRQRLANQSWQVKLTPPHVQNIVESNLAGLVDPQLRFRVKPRARFFDPGEYELVTAGAKAHEILHRHQLACDRFDEKQWPFALQDAIGGLTVAKNFWRREKVRRPQLQMQADPGSLLPRLVEVETLVTEFDGPTTEVVNVEDFFWHEAAVELQRSPIVAHRVWIHYTDLKANEKTDSNPFGYENLADLQDARGRGEEYSANRIADGTSRSKDMIEVLEIWWKEDSGKIWTVTLGNRKAELKPPRRNPFWHGEYPFVVCSSRPDLFAIPGVSQVEKIAHLQDAHWDLENQLRANVELSNNFIVAVNTMMVDDIDALVHEPGARWPVEGPLSEALQQFSPDTNSTTLALPHLSRLESQMQNLGGSQPFSTTSEARGIGADTATEAALVTNLAQRATMQLKQQLNHAYGRIGQQRTQLNQQFIRTPLAVEQIGLNNESEFVPIMPYLLQGEYLFDISPMNESLMRAERKAEANALAQILHPWVALQLHLSQAGAATPINTDALLEYVIEQNGIDEPRRFFTEKQAAPPQAPQGQQGLPSPDAGGGGVTGPGSIDPAVSPSAQVSQSPETMMHRNLAMSGGINNT